jgi:hypothetical protein
VLLGFEPLFVAHRPALQKLLQQSDPVEHCNPLPLHWFPALQVPFMQFLLQQLLLVEQLLPFDLHVDWPEQVLVVGEQLCPQQVLLELHEPPVGLQVGDAHEPAEHVLLQH